MSRVPRTRCRWSRMVACGGCAGRRCCHATIRDHTRAHTWRGPSRGPHDGWPHALTDTQTALRHGRARLRRASCAHAALGAHLRQGSAQAAHGPGGGALGLAWTFAADAGEARTPRGVRRRPTVLGGNRGVLSSRPLSCNSLSARAPRGVRRQPRLLQHNSLGERHRGYSVTETRRSVRRRRTGETRTPRPTHAHSARTASRRFSEAPTASARQPRPARPAHKPRAEPRPGVTHPGKIHDGDMHDAT